MESEIQRKRILDAARLADELDRFRFPTFGYDPGWESDTVDAFKDLAKRFHFAVGRVAHRELEMALRGEDASGTDFIHSIPQDNLGEARSAFRRLVPAMTIIRELRDDLEDLEPPASSEARSELIPWALRSAFREHLVAHYSIEAIEKLFSGNRIDVEAEYEPPQNIKGRQRRLIEQHYASLDFSAEGDAHRFLRMLSGLVEELSRDGAMGDYEARALLPELERAIEAGGFVVQPGPSVVRAGSEIAEGTTREEKAEMGNRVFVVHGRNHAVRDAFCEWLRTLSLVPIAWEAAVRATGNASATTLDIVRQGLGMADAVAVLFTPDEVASLREDFGGGGEGGPRYQARPNVLLEAGISHGLNPKKTVVIEVGMVHEISDFAGLNTIRLSRPIPDALHRLRSRLETAGCTPDAHDDPAWLNEKRFAVLFEAAPPPATTLKEITDRIKGDVEIGRFPRSPAEDDAASSRLDGLTAADIIELLADLLPKAGFHLYADLDRKTGMPPGTWKKYGPDAAKKKDRLSGESDNGMRLSNPRLLRRM